MLKLASVAVIGVALASMGCQEQAKPPQSPQASAQPQPPEPPPGPPGAHHGGGRPDMAGAHPRGPGPGGHWGPRGEGPGDDGPPRGRQARGGKRHDGSGGHMAARRGGGRRPGAQGMHPGMQGHPGGRGQEIMRELGMLGVHFYPPPMVLRRAKDIGLTPDQVTKLRDEMLATRKKSIDLHGKLQHTRVEMVRLLAADKVDERAVGAQVDEGAKAEAEMHKLHVGSMVRVRALLTPEQRQKLDEPKAPGRPGGGGGGGGGRVGMADGPDGDDDDADDDDDDDMLEG